jgi:hypothetical protein
MSIIDYILNLFKNGKNNATIYTIALKKEYNTKDPLEIGLYDHKTPIPNEDLGIEINGKQYIRTTDEKGIARLNINLPVGLYSAKIYWRGNKTYNKTTAYADITITTPTYIDGINLTKNEGDPTPYQCAVYRQDNQQRIKQKVNITINGKTYDRKSDENGLYHLNINLPQGTYPITVEYTGNKTYKPSTTSNTITINPKPQKDKKPIILGCDANTSNDKTVQDTIAKRLEADGYNVEKLPIGPNYFASTDYSSKAKGKIGIYLIASGIFSIADAAYGSGQFDNYIFGIRGDFGDKGATNFDTPIRADADCTNICDKLNGKTFNQMNAMLQPYVAICGGADTEALANNILNWLHALENRKDDPTPQPTNYSQEILQYFQSKFGNMTCIDDCLEAIQGNGYGYYYDDQYSNKESINRMANGYGVNCTDSCHVFWHLGKALGYDVKCLHIGCSGGDGHVRLQFNRGEGWFNRDPAAVLNGNSITSIWCSNGTLWDTNPDWFMENLNR